MKFRNLYLIEEYTFIKTNMTYNWENNILLEMKNILPSRKICLEKNKIIVYLHKNYKIKELIIQGLINKSSTSHCVTFFQYIKLKYAQKVTQHV